MLPCRDLSVHTMSNLLKYVWTQITSHTVGFIFERWRINVLKVHKCAKQLKLWVKNGCCVCLLTQDSQTITEHHTHTGNTLIVTHRNWVWYQLTFLLLHLCGDDPSAGSTPVTMATRPLVRLAWREIYSLVSFSRVRLKILYLVVLSPVKQPPLIFLREGAFPWDVWD